MKERIFCVCYRTYKPALTGGPGGVNYRLLKANEKYHSIENMIHIFQDVAVESGEIKKIDYDDSQEGLKEIINWFEALNMMYAFDNKKDIFIFHDCVSAYVGIKNYDLKKTILVYHQQGTLYREMISFGGEEDENVKKLLDGIMFNTIKMVKLLAFPSYGAKKSVIESDISFEEVITNKSPEIVYNGCDRVEGIIPKDNIVSLLVELMKKEKKATFISVADLNEAKGVERIPEYLAKVKERYGDIRWIVVGSGIKENELEENIEKYGIENDTYWLPKRVEHNELMALFECTDFYIMAHRFSIFDFAIIEAMGYGNIPVLTAVGGNFEIICEGNGVLIKDLSEISEFEEFMKVNDIESAKKRNREIVDRKYSEKAFITGYVELINKLSKV